MNSFVIGQGALNPYLAVTLFVCVGLAALWDFRTRRIPNWITYPGMAAAVMLHLAAHGWPGVTHSLLGLATGFGLLFLVYLAGGMGAGDVKLLSAVGAFLGPSLVFASFLWTALVGGALAMLAILYKRAAVQTLRNLQQLLFGWMLKASQRDLNLTIQNNSLIKLPYGIAIALGTVLAVWQGMPRF
ncbi:MAG: prepilin peptidase [Acidobacteriota bacterium]